MMTKKQCKQQGRNAYAQNIIRKGQRVIIGGDEYAYSHMAREYLGLIRYPAGLVRVSYEENK